MNNKNRFIRIGTALAYLMLLPNVSFSQTINNNTGKYSGLYVSGQYKPSVSSFSNFSVKETNFSTTQLIGLKKDADSIDIDKDGNRGISKHDNFTLPYIAEFQDNAISFGGAIGYSSPEGVRFELEASYEEFEAKDPGGYTIKDAYRYFALAREMKDGKPNKESEKPGYFYTVMRNDGLSISSIVINVCYDLYLDNLDISPYACAGIGENFIEFFNTLHAKFAYQGKLGISYSISSQISVFADGYYHRVMDNKFSNLSVQHVGDLKNPPKTTSAVATLNIGYFGGEVGVRFAF